MQTNRRRLTIRAREPKRALSHPYRWTAIIALCLTTLMAITVVVTVKAHTAKAGPANVVQGLWRTHTGELVHFYSCGGGICGKLMSAPRGQKRDTHNPNPKLRKRNIKGLTIIKSRRKAGPGQWHGTVYNVKNGRTYRGSLKLTGPRRAKLTGCDGAFCQSATWTKISKTRIANN